MDCRRGSLELEKRLRRWMRFGRYPRDARKLPIRREEAIDTMQTNVKNAFMMHDGVQMHDGV